VDAYLAWNADTQGDTKFDSVRSNTDDSPAADLTWAITVLDSVAATRLVPG
jgi:hypothetical protein